jgi:hypothetical protein
MLPNEKGRKHSVTDTKTTVRVRNRRMVTGQRVRESHVWKKIERYLKRERQVNVTVGQEMRLTFTKENSTCYVFVPVKFNGNLKFAGTVKIRGFDTFS